MKYIITILFFCSILFATPKNMFFISKDSMSLTCDDIKEIVKINNQLVDVSYTESGRKKIYNLTNNNINGKLALVANKEVIFMNIHIYEGLMEKELSTSIESPRNYTPVAT